MELLQLKYFLEVARSEHLTKTAEKLIVTPSVISSSISRLETELGVKLFDRTGRNIKLNKCGEIFYQHISTAMEELEDAKKDVQMLSEKEKSQLIVASWNPALVEEPIRQFCRQHPEITFKHIPFDPVASEQKFPSIDCDFIIASVDAFDHPKWEKQVFFNDCILLAVPPKHPFSERKSIDLLEAKDEWFVSTSEAAFSRRCKELCRMAGFEPKSRLECDYTLRPKMVQNEQMVCLTTYMAKISGLYDGIPLLHLSNPPGNRQQALFWKKNKSKSRAAIQFQEHIMKYFAKYDSQI